MGFFDQFPYYNPYQLNLDWIITQMRKFEADYNQLDPESFLRKSGGLVSGPLQMVENGSIDMNGKPLVGLKTAVNSSDALPFGQAEGLYLHKTGGTMGGNIDMDGHNVTGLGTPIADTDAATKQYVDLKIGTPEEPGAYLPLAGGMMSGDINMDGHVLTGIQNPINGLDAVNKSYLDGINGAIRQWALGQFAPTGFGLGKTLTGDALADANSATKSGWYKISSTTDNGIGSNCVIRVDAYGDNNCFQTAYLISSQSNTFIMRQCRGGVWSEWEWENPPMALGVEYRTTERWNGQALYTQYIEVGVAANGASVRKPAGASAIVRHQSYIGSLLLPLGQKYIERSGYFAYTTSRTDDGFYLLTDTLSDGYGSGGYKWYEQMWYTK